MTVALVGAATTAAAMWTIDQLPDDSSPSQLVEMRPVGSAIETGSLPRESLYPEADGAESENSDLPDGEVSRFEFAPSDAFDPSSEDWPSVVTLKSEDQNSWSTETRSLREKNALVAGKPPILASTPPELRPRRYFGSLSKRLSEIGPAATKRIEAKFESAKVAWPPTEIALVAIKDQKNLELHARSASGAWSFVHAYKVLAASGRKGPKLTRGDKQVPEGVYRISLLNPNSRYHVSMRVSYPNAFDRKMAQKDGRKDLGGDIMIHGKRSSAGCLAMGDDAAEELFVLAAAIGVSNIRVVIAPTDFRRNGIPPAGSDQPAWLAGLYKEVASEMAQYKAPPETPTSSLMSLLGL